MSALDSALSKLLSEYGNAMYACGEWDGPGDEYKLIQLTKAAHNARAAFANALQERLAVADNNALHERLKRT